MGDGLLRRRRIALSGRAGGGRQGRGEEIPLAEFTRGLDPISQDIVSYGGLFNYNKARLAGEVSPPRLAEAETDPKTG